jgi:hypothetical protein
MKKLLLTLTLALLLFSFIMLTMTCDEDTGLGSILTPENIFAGNEWEYKYISTEGVLLLHQIITFTDNNFIFNEPTNFWQNKSSTYNGTYSLSYDESKMKILTLVSDKPTLNGQVYYEYYEKSDMPTMAGGLSEAGDLVFYGKPFESTVDLPIKMTKTN